MASTQYSALIKTVIQQADLQKAIDVASSTTKLTINKIEISQAAISSVQAQLGQMISKSGGVSKAIELDISGEKTSTIISQIESQLSSIGKATNIRLNINEEGEVIGALAQVKTDLQNIETYILSINQETGLWEAKLKSVSAPVEKASSLMAKANEENIKFDEQTQKSQVSKEAFIERYTTKLERMAVLNKMAFNDPHIQELFTNAQVELNGIMGTGTEQTKNFTKAFNDLNVSMAKFNKESTSGIKGFISEMGTAIIRTIEWTVAVGGLYGIIHTIQDGMQYIKDLNKAMTDVKLITGATNEEVRKLAFEYNKLGQELGITTLEIAKGAEGWIRQGKSAQETAMLTKDSAMMAKIAGMDQAQATEALTSTMNTYKMSVDEVLPSIDKIIAVDNAFAVSTEGVSQAMERSSAVASDLGISYEKLIAIITTIQHVSQLPSETVGTGVRAILTRMANVKAGKSITEEGEDISQVEEVLKQYGIYLRDQTTHQFRDFNVVLEETAKVYNQLGKEGRNVEQSQIAQVFAGQRQVVMFRTLMNNQEVYNKALNTEADSIGLTVERYKEYQNSLEGTSETAKAKWEELWQTILDPSAMTGLNKVSAGIAEHIKKMSEGNATSLIPTFDAITRVIKGATDGLRQFDELTKSEDTQKRINDLQAKLDKLKYPGYKEGTPGQALLDSQIKAYQNQIDLLKQLISLENDDTRELERLKNMTERHTSGVNDANDAADLTIKNAYDLKQASENSTKTLLENDNALSSIVEDYKKYGEITVDQAMNMIDMGYASALAFDEENNAIRINVDLLRKIKLEKLDLAVVDALDAYNAAVRAKATQKEIQDLWAKWEALKELKDLYSENSEIITFQSKMNDLASDYKDILQDIIAMIKQEKQAEIDNLKSQEENYKNIIDAKKKSLDLTKDELDYQDELADKNKELSNIQNELLALQFDDSQEAQARKLELLEEEAKKKKEIDKFQRDESIDKQKDALDEEYDNYKSGIEARIKVIQSYLNQSGRIAQDAIDLLTNHAEETYNRLIEWNRIYGTGIDKDIRDKWGNAIDYANGRVSEFESKTTTSFSNVSGAATTMFEQINSEADKTTEHIAILTDKLTEAQRQWNSIVNYGNLNGIEDYVPSHEPTTPGLYGPFHDGAESGFVGGVPDLQSHEVFAKLMTGELVVNQDQMTSFINKTLPNIISSSGDMNSSMGDIILNFPNLTSMDKEIIPQLSDALFNSMNKALNNRGTYRNANAFSI